MCNPRRVQVRLTRVVSQAFRAAIEQTARLSDEVRETAQVTADLRLDDELGDVALVMIGRLVRGDFPDFEPWQASAEGTFRRQVGEVTLVYRPGERQMTIESRLSQTVTATARATAEASGMAVGEVVSDATARYFDDNWGGHTEDRARAVASAEAERRLADAIEQLGRRQNAESIATGEADARARAERQAESDLDAAREQVREALWLRLTAILGEAEQDVRREINRLVGETYRRGLIQLVHENGGRIVSDRRTGSVMNLEVELS